LKRFLIPVLLVVLAAQPFVAWADEAVVPTINASLATVDVHVGSGQQFGSLQAAIDSIPGGLSSNYRILVHPGTYLTDALLTGKNTGSGAVISIENAEQTKPLFVGSETRGGGTWSALPGYTDIYYTSGGGVLAVTDKNDRLVKVASVDELGRTNGGWYSDGNSVYVRLYDLANANSRNVELITKDYGLRVSGVPNVLIKGLRFEHYAQAGVWFDNSGSSSVRSVWTEDTGSRGPDDAGILFIGSPSSSAINVVATSVLGSGIRLSSSNGVQLYNNTFHRDTVGVDLVGSSGVTMMNNVYGVAFEAPVRIDAASRSGLQSTRNTYWNPSGMVGEVNGTAYGTVADLGIAAGGESASELANPRYRSTTSAKSSEVSTLLSTITSLDQNLFGGAGWSANTNAANLGWDQSYLADAYLKLYRATRDTRWLQKIVVQSDAVWANATENAASPGAGPDGYLGWSTSRYSVALAKPSTISSTGGSIRMVNSSGGVLTPPNQDYRIYGPGNGDSIPSKKVEVRFTSGDHYELWDVTSGSACHFYCSSSVANYPSGSSNVTIDDPNLESMSAYDIRFQIAGPPPPAVGDIYRIELVAKKELEYPNLDARLVAPMIDFAAEVRHDPSIQQISANGGTLLSKANDYINKTATHIFPKWEPYYRYLPNTPGNFGIPGGVYTYPSDPQYVLPSNTYPMNMQADIGRLWVYMCEATGQLSYCDHARTIAQFISSRFDVRTSSDGSEFYYWDYWEPAGAWDTWATVIPEDVNHGGLVADFVMAMRELGQGFSDTDLVRMRNTFTKQLWNPVTKQIYWYFDRTTPLSYGASIYWFHDWLDLPGAESVAQLTYDIYTTTSGYNTVTGVVYQMMADAALKMSRQSGAENYRVRSGSSAIRTGNNHGYDQDYDGRVRSALGTFDRGAFSFIPLERLSGSNRYNTAIAISKDQYPQGTNANAVVLVRGDVFADGLSGAPLASQENAPILLTKSGQLLPEVLDEIKRVLPSGGKIFVLGGTAAISDTVVAPLTAAGYQVERLSGVDRYETATVVAARLNQVTEAFIASGTSFPDPLAASAVAANRKAAILLSKKTSLPSSTKNFLQGRTWSNLHLVGGTAALDGNVETAVAAYGSTDRIWGSNRYATATALAKNFFATTDSVTFSTGTNFPDSLVAGPHAGSGQVAGPIILVQPTAVPKEVSSYLGQYAAQIMSGFIYGGAAAVSDSVKAQLESLL
jgi:parallel beta-helix repeat protein